MCLLDHISRAYFSELNKVNEISGDFTNDEILDTVYFHFVIWLYHCSFLGDEASNGLTVSVSVLNQPLCDGIAIKLLAAQTTEQVCLSKNQFSFGQTGWGCKRTFRGELRSPNGTFQTIWHEHFTRAFHLKKTNWVVLEMELCQILLEKVLAAVCFTHPI